MRADRLRTWWTFHRRLQIGVVVTVVLVAAAAVVLAGSRSGSTPRAHASHTGPAPRPTVSRDPGTITKVPNGEPARPKLIDPPHTAIQSQVDAELAQAETPAAIAAAEKVSVPAPAVSVSYPSVATADRNDPNAYATAFVTELLDTHYDTETRLDLLAWSEHEEAPNTLPGVPASVGPKALVLSLADPDLPGGTPSPVPAVAQWQSDAQEGVVQSVSDVQVEVNPDWTELVAEGWQPRDPRLTMETVTGTMTVTTNGHVGVAESFSLSVTLGSAAHAPGYGAVAVGNWVLD
jgi:hypothetical protein